MSNKWQVWLTNWPIMKLKKRLHAVWILTRAHYFLGFYICLCIFVHTKLYSIFFSPLKSVHWCVSMMHIRLLFCAAESNIFWEKFTSILYTMRPRGLVECCAVKFSFDQGLKSPALHQQCLSLLCHMTRTLCCTVWENHQKCLIFVCIWAPPIALKLICWILALKFKCL